MKAITRCLIATAVVFTASTLFVQQAFAYITLNGMVPVSSTGLVIIQAHGLGGTTSDALKFKFSAPAINAAYALNFCIGPATNPCGSATSYVVNVPGGQERLAVVPASIFANNVLLVSQGTSRPVPFAVTIE
jgi:hypothetical protein